MRVVLMDPNGSVYDAGMVPLGTMLPVKHYVTKTPEGEVVLVAQLDTERAPQGVWNVTALG